MNFLINSFLSSVPVFFFQPAEEDLVWEDEGELLLQDFLSNDLDKCRRPESRDGGGRDRDTSTPMSVVCMDTQPGAGNESKRRDGGSGRNSVRTELFFYDEFIGVTMISH